METFYLQSRDELSDTIKENNIVDFTNNSRKLIVVDQGERVVWKMTEINTLKPKSYYVHANMSDTCIYFKLKEVVDTTESDEGIPESAAIYVKDKLLTIESNYEQVADALWGHIHSLEETERETFISKYENYKQLYLIYKAQLKMFIAKKVTHQS